MWFLNELDLDPRQRDELSAIWLEARRTIGEMQVNRWRSMTELADLASADPLDKEKLDVLATAHGEVHQKAAQSIATAVARIHAALRPEQRARLRELIERAGLWRFSRPAATAPADGPYR